MKALSFYNLAEVDFLAEPAEPEDLTLESPAIIFFTDFTKSRPLVLESGTSAVDAQEMMKKAHVRLKFVIDSRNRFIGVIAADDLQERKIVQRLSKTVGREDLSVTDLMTPRKELRALDYDDVRTCSIGRVISTLQDSGRQHCLVLDREAHRIRGIFSASDISRRLHLPIDIQDSSSFYRVFAATS